MSMFVYKGGGGVKNALNSVYVVCTHSLMYLTSIELYCNILIKFYD